MRCEYEDLSLEYLIWLTRNGKPCNECPESREGCCVIDRLYKEGLIVLVGGCIVYTPEGIKVRSKIDNKSAFQMEMENLIEV